MASDDRDGARRITDERRRQQEAGGYGPQHDDRYRRGQLAAAAACYAAPEPIYVERRYAKRILMENPWPWSEGRDRRPGEDGTVNREKQSIADRIRELERAGALVAAEIDRLLRLAKKPEPVLAVGQVWVDIPLVDEDGGRQRVAMRLLEKAGHNLWRVEVMPPQMDHMDYSDESTIRAGRRRS